MSTKKRSFKRIVNELLPVIEQAKTVDLIEVNEEEMFLDVDAARYYNRHKNRYDNIDTTVLTRHEYETMYQYLGSLCLGDEGYWSLKVYYDDSGYDYWTEQKGESNIVIIQLDITKNGLTLLDDPAEMRRLKSKYTSFVNMVCHYLKELMMSKKRVIYK